MDTMRPIVLWQGVGLPLNIVARIGNAVRDAANHHAHSKGIVDIVTGIGIAQHHIAPRHAPLLHASADGQHGDFRIAVAQGVAADVRRINDRPHQTNLLT